MSRDGSRFALLAVLAAFCAALFLRSGARAGVVGSPHDFSPTSLLTTYQTTPITSSGACSICHIPHNATDNVLWPRALSQYRTALGMDGGTGSSTDLPTYRRFLTLQCYDCHDAHVTTVKINDVPAFSLFATNHKPQNIAFGFTKPSTGKDSGSTMKEDEPAGAEAGYYENSPPFQTSPQTYYGADSRSGSFPAGSEFRPRSRLNTDNTTLAKTGGHYFKSLDPTPGSIYKGDKLPCSDCHDPHAWDSANKDWHAFFRPQKLYGYPTRTARWTAAFGTGRPRGSGLMANDLLPGSAARDNANSRRLCALCHGYSDTLDSVTFNDINSDYTSTQKIVRPPDTIGEHLNTSSVACVTCHAHNSIGANCSQCHGFPPAPYPTDRGDIPMGDGLPDGNYTARDPHPIHYGKFDNGAVASIYNYNCTVCHATSALGSRPGDIHQNTSVNLAYDFSFLGVANPPDNTSGGGYRCFNVYCHSYGAADNTIAGYFRAPEWGKTTPVPLRCNACHGPGTPDNTVQTGMPNYPTGPAGFAAANSHQKHVENAGYDCAVCHVDTAQGNFATGRTIKPSPLRHVNGLREVAFDGLTAVPRSGSGYDNTLGNKTCNVNCHSPVTLPQWGGTLSCDGCHESQGAGKGTYTYTGPHRRHTDNTAYRFACEQCHALNSTQGNTVHVSGDNSATPRYVEVRFTDNAAPAWNYDNTTWTYRTLDVFRKWFEDNTFQAPSYTDNSTQGGIDNVNNAITWSTGTCGTVWCHSNANPLPAGGGNNVYRSPTWTNPTNSCTVCHRGPEAFGTMSTAADRMSRGHWKHLAPDRYGFACDECHADTAAADATTAIRTPGGHAFHVNGNKQDVKGGTGIRLTSINDNTLLYNPSTRVCSNTYCHSAGTDNTFAGGFDNTVPSPAWGSGTTTCTSCHGGNLASGNPMSTGKHLTHLQQGYRCSSCHSRTVAPDSDNVINTTTDNGYLYHVNGIKDVQAGDGYSFTPGSCNDISCHGGNSLDNTFWSPPATLPSCFSCHWSATASEQLHKPIGAVDNVPNPVDNAQYMGAAAAGHGRTGSNYPGLDGIPPAGFANAANDNNADCYYCHSRSAPHGKPTAAQKADDPFRLGFGTDNAGQKHAATRGAFADNTDALCLRCHGASPTSPPGASSTAARSMQIHAQGITGSKYTWTNTPWKCVDCHDPHGDANWTMVRSGINAPLNSGDGANAGSDVKSVPKRTSNISAVTFTSQAGFGAGSYAQSGNGPPWGPCEVCHTQTNAYSRTLDNAATHASRTNRCATCHPHSAGFGPTACKGCHGGETGDPGQVSNNAPNITLYWKTSGHGADWITSNRGGTPIECEDCHDTSYLTAADHKTDGSAGAGPPPANVNSETWPTRTLNANTSPNRNTAHLKASYFPSVSPSFKYEYALAFDARCGNEAAGCHQYPGAKNYAHDRKIHPAVPPGSSSAADNALRFGDGGSVGNPKSYYWYQPPFSDYRTQFYMSPSPWTITDITTLPSERTPAFSDNGVAYGVCVSCHDPHGTNSPSNVPGYTTNLMLRGNSKNQNQFCNAACHTSRNPP